MKKIMLTLTAVPFILLSCNQGWLGGPDAERQEEEGLSHEMIVLGEQLEDPYSVSYMTKALQNIQPNGRTALEPTDFYVRFLPKDDAQLQKLLDAGLELIDHPMDYRIIRDGDWYHDPDVPEGNITWQYAVVPVDFPFPSDVRYERLDDCYIAEHDPATKGSGIDWDAVEREAFRLSGNENLLAQLSKAGESGSPKGRIAIVDPALDDEPEGVKGVKVFVNSFVKFAVTYTDDEGYYKIARRFNSEPRYRLVFQNVNGFKQGINLVLIPASVSTLGRHPAEGFDCEIDFNSDRKLFTRCVVNNAGFDYCAECEASGKTLPLPPKDLRIWDIPVLDCSFELMMHHGTIVDTFEPISSLLGEYTPLIKLLHPDIYLGLHETSSYSEIYARALHVFAKAGHFAQVGKSWWSKLVEYTALSLLGSGLVSPYGAPDDDDSGYCETANMYAYYCQSILFKRRYKDSTTVFGTSEWFSPQILMYLDERGLGLEKIAPVFTADVVDLEGLKNKLLSYYPSFKSTINEAFARYGR